MWMLEVIAPAGEMAGKNMETVSERMCAVRSGNIEKEIDSLSSRVNKHGEQIDEVSSNLAKASAILDSCAERLSESERRIKALEDKPVRRTEQIITTAINWATLIVLGLLAAKIGL